MNHTKAHVSLLLPCLGLIIFLLGCVSEKDSVEKVEAQSTIISEVDKNINYYEFQPDTVAIPLLNGIGLDYAYQFGKYKIVAGYYSPKDNGELSDQDSENDWGDRLFLLDENHEIKYRSQGVGDVYLFEPHFYMNDQDDKIIIICQLGFEYFMGGEVFLFEDGGVIYVGNLNVETYYQVEEEECLTDIVLINEENGQLSFTFNSDSLILDPAGVDFEVVPNNSMQFIFDGTELKEK